MRMKIGVLWLFFVAGSTDGQDDNRFFDAEAIAKGTPEVIASEGFENYHPDMRYRRLAVQARIAGRDKEAREFFQRAARYADKLSQGALAEMLWLGQGGSTDRALAYAWMDLAAERGAPMFLVFREKYWDELSENERATALTEGHKIYAEYGDAVAKPRLEQLLRKGRKQVTGSRVGWLGSSLKIYYPGRQDFLIGDNYYADHLWQPQDYWDWQNDLVRAPSLDGRVDVGPTEKVDEQQTQERPGSDR